VVDSIPVGTHYIGPSGALVSLCSCSTVTYSLISACGGCQNRTFLSWPDWAVNCPQVEVAQFLQTVPAQTVVPSWAYLDVTKSNNTFNPVLANQSLSNSGSSSSSLASIPPTSSSVAFSSTTAVSLPSTSPATPQKATSNAGAIAGGVVGGLVILVAAGLAALFYFRRRNRPLDETGQFPSNFSTSGPSVFGLDSRTTAPSPLSITPYHYEPFGKDMSEAGHTYPGSPVASVVHTTYDAPSPGGPAIEVLHRYTGSAEI